MKKNILLVGYGKLGKLIANELLALEHNLTVVKRSFQDSDDNINFISHDIRTAPHPYLSSTHFDDVIICVTPSQRNKIAYQDIFLDGVLPFIKQIKTDHIWFISSSAVYHQNDGSWVNEQSNCEPQAYNAEILLQCEQAIEQFAKLHNVKSSALRLAGIYGSGRRHLINILENEHYPEQKNYTNRIHQVDAAKAIAILVDKQAEESIINICDNYPATMFEVADFVRTYLNISGKKPWAKPLNLNKQISNACLKHYYNEFQYPTYKEGLIESMENS